MVIYSPDHRCNSYYFLVPLPFLQQKARQQKSRHDCAQQEDSQFARIRKGTHTLSNLAYFVGSIFRGIVVINYFSRFAPSIGNTS